jgi:FMN-dependent NADH-azoreductase
MNLLHVIASPMGKNSTSLKLSTAIVKKIKLANAKSANSTVEIQERNVVGFPHVTEEYIAAANSKEGLTDRQKEVLKTSDEAVAQLVWADTIVIGLPMHNFAIPSYLKAWLDQITRPGKTFAYTADGRVGLLTNKKVYLAISSGGAYTNTVHKDWDFTAKYLKVAFDFIGLSDLTIFRAEGTAVPHLRDAALPNALNEVELAFK